MTSNNIKAHEKFMCSDNVPPGPVLVEDLQNLIGELRMMAKRLLVTESRAHSFTPTALAMTALRRAKLMEQDWETVRWENRAHFFAAMATAMRNALIDHARRRKAKGRDSLIYFSPDEIHFVNISMEAEQRPERIIILEEALARIETVDKRLSDVIHQFYFAGYSISEMARFTGVSEKTIDRDLKKARTLLKKIVDRLLATA
jgi:RNA polymerase sigma factor (TIGR02999 family)